MGEGNQERRWAGAESKLPEGLLQVCCTTHVGSVMRLGKRARWTRVSDTHDQGRQDSHQDGQFLDNLWDHDVRIPLTGLKSVDQMGKIGKVDFHRGPSFI